MLFSDLMKIGAAHTEPLTDSFGVLAFSEKGVFTGSSCALGAVTAGFIFESGEYDDFEGYVDLGPVYTEDGASYEYTVSPMPKGKAAAVRKLLSARGHPVPAGEITAQSNLQTAVVWMNDVARFSREEIADIIVELRLDFDVRVPVKDAKIFEGEPLYK